MPYKDKEAYAQYMRDYRKRKPVNPAVNPIKAKLEAVGLKVDGNMVSLAVKPVVKQGVPPIYDWTIHRPGDRVRVWQGDRLVETVVPEDGVGTCAGVKLVSRNLDTPAFNPNPKPEPKAKRKKRW